jgi:hypothetical protein
MPSFEPELPQQMDEKYVRERIDPRQVVEPRTPSWRDNACLTDRSSSNQVSVTEHLDVLDKLIGPQNSSPPFPSFHAFSIQPDVQLSGKWRLESGANQIGNGRLSPFLFALGLFAIRRFVAPMLPGWSARIASL